MGDVISISSTSSDSSSDECSLSDQLDSDSSYSSSDDEQYLWRFPSERQKLTNPNYQSVKDSIGTERLQSDVATISDNQASKSKHRRTPIPQTEGHIKSKDKRGETWSPARTVRSKRRSGAKSKQGFAFAKVPSEIWSSAKQMAKLFISPAVPERFDFANRKTGDGASEKLLSEHSSDDYDEVAVMDEDLALDIIEKPEDDCKEASQEGVRGDFKVNDDPPDPQRKHGPNIVKCSSRKEKRRIVPSLISSEVSPTSKPKTPTKTLLEHRRVAPKHVHDSPQTAACKTFSRLTLKERNTSLEENDPSRTGRATPDEPLDLSRNRRKERTARNPFEENRENVFSQKVCSVEKQSGIQTNSGLSLKSQVCESQVKLEFDTPDIPSKDYRRLQDEADFKVKKDLIKSDRIRSKIDRGIPHNKVRDLLQCEGSSEELEPVINNEASGQWRDPCPRSPASVPRATKSESRPALKHASASPVSVQPKIHCGQAQARLSSGQKPQRSSISSPVAFFKMMKLKQGKNEETPPKQMKDDNPCSTERDGIDTFAMPLIAKQSPSNIIKKKCTPKSRKALVGVASDGPEALTSTPTKRSKTAAMSLDLSCIPSVSNARKETTENTMVIEESQEVSENAGSVAVSEEATSRSAEETHASDRTWDMEPSVSYAKPMRRGEPNVIESVSVSESDTCSEGEETFSIEAPSPYTKYLSIGRPPGNGKISTPGSTKKGGRLGQSQSSSRLQRHTSPTVRTPGSDSRQKGGSSSGKFDKRGTSSTKKIVERRTPRRIYSESDSDDSSSDESEGTIAAPPHSVSQAYKFFPPDHRQNHSPSGPKGKSKAKKADLPKSLRQLKSLKSSPKALKVPPPKVQNDEEGEGEGQWNWSLNHTKIDTHTKQALDVYELEDSESCDSDTSDSSELVITQQKHTASQKSTYKPISNLKVRNPGKDRAREPSPRNEKESLLVESGSFDSDSTDEGQPLLNSRADSRSFSSSTICHGPGKCDKTFCFTCV